MEFLKKFDLTGVQFLKLIGLLALLLLALSVLTNLFGGSFGIGSSRSMMPTFSNTDYYATTDSVAPQGLSLRNSLSKSSLPPSPNEGYATGNDAEAFEVKEYNASIETRNLENDCSVIRELKARPDVIFENASAYERGCNFTFKVEKGSVEEVLTIIKNLDPRELRENTYTIKSEVEDYTSEITILENKLASLDKTLADATASYDSISALATKMGSVESLAKIIDSKLLLLERLTSARIETSNQLDRMNRAKADALDRLTYTYFSVNVYENKFVDGTQIQNSWKSAVQQFVRESNLLVQELSIGLVALLLNILKFALYFIILLFVARFGWTFAKNIWSRG